MCVSIDRFEELVAQALDGLPAELGRAMDNVAVVVEEGSEAQPLFGLYQGVPLTQRSTGYYGVTPDRIIIYRHPMCDLADSEDALIAQVRRTVIHEVGHHFGIDDRRLHELGWG